MRKQDHMKVCGASRVCVCVCVPSLSDSLCVCVCVAMPGAMAQLAAVSVSAVSECVCVLVVMFACCCCVCTWAEKMRVEHYVERGYSFCESVCSHWGAQTRGLCSPLGTLQSRGDFAVPE